MADRALIVIPARMASTRFPDKPLAPIAGVSLVERVWRIACNVASAQEVVIATDSEELRAKAEGFGASVMMTSSSCRTGTDRVAETVRNLDSEFEIAFSLQGDAVLTPPWVIEEVLACMLKNPSIEIATPAVQLKGEELLSFVKEKKAGSSSGTSVVFDKQGDAMYFSKGAIPFNRDPHAGEGLLYRHIGLYGYRTPTLLRFAELPEGDFERVEKLEQLRALENGISIRVVCVDYRGRSHASVDRPEDVEVVENIIEKEGELISGTKGVS